MELRRLRNKASAMASAGADTRPPTRRLRLAWTICALLIMATAAVAQTDRTLQVRVEPVGLGARTGGLIPVNVVFERSGKGLLEGRLLATFHDGREVLAVYESDDLVLAEGSQTFHMNFPPLSVSSWNSPIDVELVFRTRQGPINLRPASLMVPSDNQTWFRICVGDPGLGGQSRASQVARGLGIERYLVTESPAEQALLSLPVRVPPEDLPVSPLEYTAYDLVVLEGQGFAALRENQLQALLRWVRAGGSVCLIPGGQLKPYHVTFLNELSEADSPTGESRSGEGAQPAFALTAAGGLEVRQAPWEAGLFLFHSGIGRTVVLTGATDAEPDLDSRAWRRAACFLWRIREDLAQRIVSSRTRRAEVAPNLDAYLREAPDPSRFVRELLPSSTRVIPLWLVLLMLGAFVLAVGPVDYLLLGLVRKRKYTWLVFPSVAALFLLLMMHLTEISMGGSDHQASVVVVDVGKGGRVLCTARYELTFAARHMTRRVALENCLYCTVRGNRYGYDNYGRGLEYDQGPPFFSGRFPGRYGTQERIRKWTPHLVRTVSLDAPVAVPELDWDRLVIHAPGQAPRLDRAALDAAGMEGLASLRWGKRASSGDEVPDAVPWRRSRYDSDGGVQNLVFALSSAGASSFTCQASPRAGDCVGDLALLDTTDPDQCLLVLVTRDGDDYVVYRRMYYGEP